MHFKDILDAEFPPCEWQMNAWEKLVLDAVLARLTPKFAIEIGSYKGGSLHVLAKHSKYVVSVDPRNTDLQKSLGSKLVNVEFRTGYSYDVLPDLINRANSSRHTPSFVLIDGDHSEQSVRGDINLILNIKPETPLIVLMHDSFNPDCRRGMESADWAACPFVHAVDLDYCPGVFLEQRTQWVEPKSMWGGFGCALLMPEKRVGDLAVVQSQRLLFEATRLVSSHRPKQGTWIGQFFQRLVGK